MDKIEDMPGHLIRRLNQIAVAVFHAEVGEAGYDLTPVQYAALRAVCEHAEVDQATLAGLIAYDRATITGVVDRLEQKGFVKREVSGRDRRAKQLVITPEGRQTLERIEPAVAQAQKAMLAGLSEAEAGTFMTLLKKATNAGNDLSRAPMRNG